MRAHRALVVSWMSPVPAPEVEGPPRFWPSFVLFFLFLLVARVLHGGSPLAA